MAVLKKVFNDQVGDFREKWLARLLLKDEAIKEG